MISGLRITFDDFCLWVAARLRVDHRVVRGAVLVALWGVIFAFADFPAPAIPFCVGAFFLLRRPRSRVAGSAAAAPWAAMPAAPLPAAPMPAAPMPAAPAQVAADAGSPGDGPPRFTVAAVAARFAALEARVKRMEAAVMSDDLALRRQFRELGA